MPYFYATSRERTLRGIGDILAPDLGPPIFLPTTAPAAPQLPPDYWGPGPARPIYVPKTPGTVIPAPDVGLPPELRKPLAKVLLPSGAPAPPAVMYAGPAAFAPGGWMDGQMIAGVPNKYLVYGAGGLLLLKFLGGKKGRR